MGYINPRLDSLDFVGIWLFKGPRGILSDALWYVRRYGDCRLYSLWVSMINMIGVFPPADLSSANIFLDLSSTNVTNR